MSEKASKLIEWARQEPARLALLAVLAFEIVYGVSSLWLPFGWDHGMMAAVGDVMARGGAMYADAWELKGPLAYVPFYLATVLFGHEMWGIRAIELAILIPSLWAMFRLVRSLTTTLVGAGAAVGLYLWFPSNGFFFTAQPEIWVTVIVAVAALLVMRAPASPRAELVVYEISGVLIGCAGLVKPHFLVFGLVPLARLAVSGGTPWRRRGMLAAVLALGAAAPIAAMLVYLIATGAFAAFIEAHFVFNATSYAGLPSGVDAFIRTAIGFFHFGAPPVLLPFAVVGLWARFKEPALFWPLAAWLVTALFVVLLQGKLFAYHWYPFYAPLLVSAALGVHALIKDQPRTALASVVAAAGALTFLSYVMLPPARQIVRWGDFMLSHDEGGYLSGYSFNAYVAADIVSAAHYIQERTNPNDPVFVWGNDASIRYLADRPDPTRFTHVLSLYAQGPLRAAYRAEMMRDLERNPPAYIAVGSPWPPGDKADAFSFFPEFAAFMRERYALEQTFGDVNIYRRIDRAPR